MNPTIHGHWYCSCCNDVVNIRKPVGRWDVRRGETCPVCQNNSADWVPDKAWLKKYQCSHCPECGQPVSLERAHELFEKMKKDVQ